MTVEETRRIIKSNIERLYTAAQEKSIEDYVTFLGLCWRDFAKAKSEHRRLVLTVAMTEAITTYNYNLLSGSYLIETCELFKQILSRLYLSGEIHYTIHAVNNTVKFYY